MLPQENWNFILLSVPHEFGLDQSGVNNEQFNCSEAAKQPKHVRTDPQLVRQ